MAVTLEEYYIKITRRLVFYIVTNFSEKRLPPKIWQRSAGQYCDFYTILATFISLFYLTSLSLHGITSQETFTFILPLLLEYFFLFLIHLMFAKYIWNNEIEEDGIGRACSTHGEKINAYRVLV
jgi:hypothetical protein